MVDSVWVVSFIEVFIKRAQKSLEIRAKFVARKSTYGYTLCFGVSVQACLLVHVLQNSRIIMSTGISRKRWNRAVKRHIEQGIISEEEAQQKFIRAQSPCSKKKAEDGIVAEEEAKSKRSSRTVEGLVNDEETKIAEQAFSPLEETVVAEETVKKEKRQKISETEETKNSDNAGRPKLCVLQKQFKGEGKGGSLGVSVGSNGTVLAGPLDASCHMALLLPVGEKLIEKGVPPFEIIYGTGRSKDV